MSAAGTIGSAALAVKNAPVSVKQHISYYLEKFQCKNNTASQTAETTNIQRNIIQGDLYEQAQFSKFKAKYSNAEKQITIKIGDTKSRLDAIAMDQDGAIVIEEYKSSPSARLTHNQAVIFRELQTQDAVVVGKGKGIFKNGFVIPAGTRVNIIRRIDFVNHFADISVQRQKGGGIASHPLTYGKLLQGGYNNVCLE